MLFLPTILLALVQLFLSVLLLRVYIYATNKKQVLMLFFITITFTAWTVVNSILLQDIASSAELARVNALNGIGFVLGAFAVLQIYNFSDYYPLSRVQKKSKYVLKFILLFGALISYAPLISGHNEFDASTGVTTYIDGELGLPYILFILFCLVLFVVNIRRSVKDSPSTKKQARTIVIGLVLTAIHGLLFIIIVPLLFGQKNIFYVIGYISPLYFVLATVYSLLRQQLFDFKSVAARAAAYLFTTVFVVFVYVGSAYLLKTLVLSELSLDKTQFFSNIVLTVFLIVLYPYVRKKFDKLTNALFFRDSYDPQVFLDELNKTLVNNIQIDSVLTKSSIVIETNLKSQFCSFFINDTTYFRSRMIGDHKSKLSAEDISTVQKLIPKTQKKIIFTEEEADNNDEQELINLLKKNDVEVLLRLVNAPNNNILGIGYLLIGPKRSGNLYNKQDLKLLGIIANELVIAVQNALRFEEIEQFNLTLQKKITDATKELKKSNEKLKALDEAKDEFISMASHQLRTPLTSVKGYLSMLAEGDAGKLNDTQKKFIDQAFISSQRMVYLIADLLNVSRLKTGKFIIESHPVYLPDVVDSEIAQLNETVKSRGLTMTFDKPKEFTMINLDETKIRQVIMNFTDNAIYYTPSGGSIKVALTEDASGVEFTVTDTGIGVPKSEQPHLFTKFYRAGNARKARPDGTGLGLFMAKKVVVAQGGSLIFKTTEGKGSTFGFRFNLTRK